MGLAAHKKVLWIPLGVAALIALAGWWCNVEVGKAIKTQLTNELQAMITADVTALEIWIDNQLRFVSVLASEEKVTDLTKNILDKTKESGSAATLLRSLESVNALKHYLGSRLRPSRLGFVVIDSDAVILAAPFEGMLGDRLHDAALDRFNTIFEKGEPVFLTPYQAPKRAPRFRRHQNFPPHDFDRNLNRELNRRIDSENRRKDFENHENRELRRPENRDGFEKRGRRNRSIMAVAAPIRNEQGKVIAAIGLILAPDQEFTRILSVAQLGETGETYAFDSSGIMLSRSRFEKNLQRSGLLEDGKGSALNLELRVPIVNLMEEPMPKTEMDLPLTRIVDNAIRGEDGVDVSRFLDYRGVSVVGAWRWLPEYEFGVATKLDATEAFQPLQVLRWVFLILLLIAALAGVALFLFSYFNLLLQKRMEDAALEAKELGQYTLEKKIGEGGMGVVYRARHALLRRETAVKLLAPEKADEDAIRHFEREVQLTCRLAHPNTIQIFDYGHTPQGIFYYAMEYLDGINLRELIAREGQLPEGRVIYILRQICASLNEAHEAGLVHRDIKAANVILCDRGGVLDMVKVLDFGLVKSYREEISTEASQSLSIAGTPQFISPEMITHPDQIDHRSDLYALGALAYFLLTGCHVFEANTSFEMMQHHVSTFPKSPNERIGKGLDADLERLVMQCLEKSPKDRPTSASELIGHLDACRASKSWRREQQIEWWKTFRESEQKKATPKSATILEPTLQINLDERTRLV